MPWAAAIRLASLRLAIENGWPPIRFVVASMRRKEIFSGPYFLMTALNFSRSRLPLKGWSLAVFMASSV